MAKYDPLNQYIPSLTGQGAVLGFKDIETVIGAPLPSSVRRYRDWWSNEVLGSHGGA